MILYDWVILILSAKIAVFEIFQAWLDFFYHSYTVVSLEREGGRGFHKLWVVDFGCFPCRIYNFQNEQVVDL